MGSRGEYIKNKKEKDGDYREKDLKQGKGMRIVEQYKDKNCIVLYGKYIRKDKEQLGQVLVIESKKL